MKDKESLAAFESQDWHFDLRNLRVSSKKKAHHYTAPEALFNLDADRSVTTLHAKNNANHASAKAGYGEASDSEEEDTDSASDECDTDKLPDSKNSDKEVGDGQKLISWSPDNPSPSDGRLTFRAADGGG